MTMTSVAQIPPELRNGACRGCGCHLMGRHHRCAAMLAPDRSGMLCTACARLTYPPSATDPYPINPNWREECQPR